MGYLRKAKLKDLDYVVKNLRVMDKIEVFYQTGQKPENAIRLSYLYTRENMAIADDDDNPIGLCCLLYTSPSPRDVEESRMPSSA